MNRCYKSLVVVAALALSLATAQGASAQGGRGFGRFAVPADLASLAEVQTELQLSDELKTKVGDIRGKLSDDRRNLFQQGFDEETWTEIDKLNRAATDKVFELLDQTQRDRLLGVSAQIMGARVIGEPAAAAELELTDEQKTKLDEVRAANRQTMQNAWMDYGHLSDEERRAKFDELAEAGDQKLMEVLTDQQRQALEDMKGAPLDVDLSPLFPGRGGS